MPLRFRRVSFPDDSLDLPPSFPAASSLETTLPTTTLLPGLDLSESSLLAQLSRAPALTATVRLVHFFFLALSLVLTNPAPLFVPSGSRFNDAICELLFVSSILFFFRHLLNPTTSTRLVFTDKGIAHNLTLASPTLQYAEGQMRGYCEFCSISVSCSPSFLIFEPER